MPYSVSAVRNKNFGNPPWWMAAGVVPLAAYQAKGAASLAASYINLANPGTYDAAPGVAPTWAVGTGWTFNGTTQYLTTGIVPVNNQTWTIIASVTKSAPLQWFCGASWAFERAVAMATGSTETKYANPLIEAVAGARTSGVFAVSGTQGYITTAWQTARQSEQAQG